jgi:Flp pilus assembly protein TadD
MAKGENTMSALENAALLIQNGHPDLAIPMIDAELARDPQNWECHVNIGIAYRLTNKFQLAVLHQNLATQLQPENAVAWHNLGVTQTELGDFKGSFLSHQKAYTLCQTSRQMCLAYAYALMRYGKFEAAWLLWEQSRNHIAALKEFRIPIWDGKQSLEG